MGFKFFHIVFICLLISSCVGLGNTISTKVDPFSGDVVSYTNKNCSGGFCTQFKIVNGNTSFLFVGYTGSNWMFLDSIQIKIKYLDKSIKLVGDFKREGLSYGGVEEILSVRVNEELHEFIKSSLGETLIVRFNGDRVYKDIEVPVSYEGQWSLFLQNYKTN